MATIERFREWFHRDLSRFGDDYREVVSEAGPWSDLHVERRETVRIYTDTNRYTISAVERSDGTNYLGCIASSRKPRAGEDHTRGNDLSDGPLAERTWGNILADIVAYEAVRVHSRARQLADETPEAA